MHWSLGKWNNARRGARSVERHITTIVRWITSFLGLKAITAEQFKSAVQAAKDFPARIVG